MTHAASNRWIGLDVGGANLKASDGEGRGVSKPFALWREPQRLADRLREVLASFAPAAQIAVTMTGELADCYATKAEGVRAILAAVAAAAGPGAAIRVATVDDVWLTHGEASIAPARVAAANWRLTARLVARRLAARGERRRALVLDAGSTTTDLVRVDPTLGGGAVLATGSNDTQRLVAGELLYTGLRRTPVSAVVRSLPYRGAECPVAAELFATTADAWLLVGGVAEDPSSLETADGRPFTARFARARLSRCVCADTDAFDEGDALSAARAIVRSQVETVAVAIRNALQDTRLAVLSGEGEPLLREALALAAPGIEQVSFDDVIGVHGAAAWAPALAAAALAAEELVASAAPPELSNRRGRPL